MIMRRCSSLNDIHAPISAFVRPHPRQRPEAGSIVQTCVQGEDGRLLMR